jgi:hypothetical protein
MRPESALQLVRRGKKTYLSPPTLQCLSIYQQPREGCDGESGTRAMCPDLVEGQAAIVARQRETPDCSQVVGCRSRTGRRFRRPPGLYIGSWPIRWRAYGYRTRRGNNSVFLNIPIANANTLPRGTRLLSGECARIFWLQYFLSRQTALVTCHVGRAKKWYWQPVNLSPSTKSGTI